MNWKTRKVKLIDVTARDGFQMEAKWIPTEEKIALISKVLTSGVDKIELTSFVSPKAVPQLKDAREVIASIRPISGNTKLIALIPNLKGAELATETEVDELNLVISISETHNQKNIRRSVADSMSAIRQIKEVLEESKKVLNIGLATVFGCPFEGLYPVSKVEKIIERLVDLGINSISLADTTGMANPKQMYDFCTYLIDKFPQVTYTLHLHNTRGMGLANILAGYQAGIDQFEATLGGIGGCPFAPGATGNVCLEDVTHMFEQMGIETGLDIDQLIMATKQLEAILGYTLPGQIMKSGKSTDLFTK